MATWRGFRPRTPCRGVVDSPCLRADTHRQADPSFLAVRNAGAARWRVWRTPCTAGCVPLGAAAPMRAFGGLAFGGAGRETAEHTRESRGTRPFLARRSSFTEGGWRGLGTKTPAGLQEQAQSLDP